MEVTYLRYQDDILILCQTKRQLERSKQRLMGVLRERRLQLSRKKTYIGAIDKGFHFLGIHYRETQTPDGTHVTRDSLDSALQEPSEQSLNLGGGAVQHQQVIRILCLKLSFRMRERYERHANKLNKWLLMVFLRRIKSDLFCRWASLVCVVGENVTKLARSGVMDMVFKGLLGQLCRVYRDRAIPRDYLASPGEVAGGFK